YQVVSFLQLFLVFILAMVALYGMGMMSASLFLLLSREAWHLSNLAQEPIYLVSGFFFPIKNLGFWVAAGASLIPLTLGLDAMRQLVFPSGDTFGFLSVEAEIAILVVLSVIFLIGARRLLAYVERLAIDKGRLTESRR
ncbi:MAG: ABC transporter permease, partial [Anaerolineales bacterium]